MFAVGDGEEAIQGRRSHERERHRHVVGSAVWKTLEDATRKLLSS